MDSGKEKLYLFIIWEKSRNKTDEILQDLKRNYLIRDVYEIKWSNEKFLNNLRRFYGKSLPDVKVKAELCGTGPFLIIIISDLKPRYNIIENKFEDDLVNSNISQSKKKYRRWIGKEFTVHSSISDNETNHNLTLLFGKNTIDFEKELSRSWDGSIKKLEIDLAGANGWKNMEELLYVMNGTVNYVILRNFEGMPTKFDYHDVDLLVVEDKLPYIVNKDFSPPRDNPRAIRFEVGNKKIVFNPNYLGDNYYDERWEVDILKRRTLHHNEFYIPSKTDYFYTLLYHVTFHKRWKKVGKISDKYKELLVNLGKESNIEEITATTLNDIDHAKKIVDTYMKKMSYRYTDTFQYKLQHSEFKRLIKSAIYIGKTEGTHVLIMAIIRKIIK